MKTGESSSNVKLDMHIKRQDLPTQIAKKLEQLIAENHFQPGDKLPPENEIAEMCGVNRATVRHALHTLETRGLIEQKIGSGTFVKNLCASTVADSIERLFIFKSCTYEELLNTREILEPAVAAQAAHHANAEDLGKLKGHLEQIEFHYGGVDFETYARADANFHVALAKAIHNRLITTFMTGIQKVMFMWMTAQAKAYEVRNEDLKHLHRNIYEGVIDRDPERAQQAMLVHIQIARQTYREYRVQQSADLEDDKSATLEEGVNTEPLI